MLVQFGSFGTEGALLTPTTVATPPALGRDS